MYRPKKTALKPFLEVDPEDHTEGGSEDDCKGYVGKDLTGSAFHNYSQISLNCAIASFLVFPNAFPEWTPSIQTVTIHPFSPLSDAF